MKIAVTLAFLMISGSIAATNPVVFPSKAVVRAIIADQASLVNVKGQLKDALSTVVTMAWDFTQNCYSETVRGGDGNQASVSCQGSLVTYNGKRCAAPVKDLTVWQTALTTKYVTNINVTEGLVDNPFVDTTEQLILWKAPTNLTWMWLNATNNNVVYLQDYDVTTKRTLVYYLPEGLTGNNGVSSYNFQLFQCPKP